MKRLSYIDWMRGLACLLMFFTHCYDSWLRPDLHGSFVYRFTQFLGTMPAPLFLFLAGVSMALVVEKLREKGITRNAIARQTILRGAEIFGLGILFRLQEYALGYKWVPWTDMLRVDILNMLGISMMFMGILCWLTSGGSIEAARHRGIYSALAAAAVVALVTPPLWTTHRPRFLPWPLETYINGTHTYNQPAHWLFPIFPWTAIAFAGLAVGFCLFSGFTRRREPLFFGLLGATGVLALSLSVLFEVAPVHIYAVHDFWHSSPQFVLARCGALLLILALTYAWCKWGFAQKGFSPMIQMGKTSLLIYWVHIEFVYGRLSFLPKHRCSIPLATFGLCVIFVAMLGLSLLRTQYKKKGTVRALQPQSPPASSPAT